LGARDLFGRRDNRCGAAPRNAALDEADNTARHEDDEDDEEGAVDRVGGADEVRAEPDAQDLGQGDGNNPPTVGPSAEYMPPVIAAKTICSDTAMPERLSGLTYIRYFESGRCAMDSGCTFTLPSL
jgi:hypothetical protein